MSAIDAERPSHTSATLHVVRSRAVLLPRELSDEEYALFVRVGRRRELKPGEVIFTRGELGRSMFIVESGQIQLEFGDGMPDKLIGAREFFGELALFIGNHARVANAIAIEERKLAEELASADQLVGHAVAEFELDLARFDDEHAAAELSAAEDHLARAQLTALADALEQAAFVVRELARQQGRARTHDGQPWAGGSRSFCVDR